MSVPPPLVPVYPNKVKPQNDFNPREFYAEVKAHGVPVLWEQAVKCPCWDNEDTREARFGCTVCEGRGWEYRPGLETMAIVTGVSLKELPFEVVGEWGFALANVTVPAEQAPGFMDRYTLLASAMTMVDTLTRSGTQDRLRAPITTRTMNLNVGGTPTEVDLDVLFLRKADADGTAGDVLERSVDFDVDSEGRIDWTLGVARGTAPAIGDSYSVRYYGLPRYVTMTQPYAIRDTRIKHKLAVRSQAPLPVRTLCRLDWAEFGERA